MKKHRIKEYIPFLEALDKGLTIEHLNCNVWGTAFSGGPSENIAFVDDPEYYRIKKPIEYIPFTKEKELVGSIITRKKTENKFLVIAQSETDIAIDGGYLTYQELFDNYTLCGGPCGKRKE